MESSYSGNGTLAGSVVPVPVSQDWKNNQLIADAKGYIHVCHVSDTFLIYTHYLFKRTSWWLRDSFYEPYPLLIGEKNTEYCSLIFQEHPIYLSFLQVCMEFFCEAVKAGIPLRGCISTGMATMNKHQSIFLGKPLVEAARGEPAQNAIDVAFGRSFNNYHPVYNRYFIPYLGNIKDNDKKSEFLSPMMLDWPQFWRNHHEYKDIAVCIAKMNTNPAFSGYYENAIKFAAFSEKNQNWPEQIDRADMTDIIDYYDRVKAWYNSVLSDWFVILYAKRIPTFIFPDITYADSRTLIANIVDYYVNGAIPKEEQFDLIVVNNRIIVFNFRKNSYSAYKDLAGIFFAEMGGKYYCNIFALDE